MNVNFVTVMAENLFFCACLWVFACLCERCGGCWLQVGSGLIWGWSKGGVCVWRGVGGGGYSVFHTVNVSVWNKKQEGVTSNFKWSPYNR